MPSTEVGAEEEETVVVAVEGAEETAEAVSEVEGVWHALQMGEGCLFLFSPSVMPMEECLCQERLRQGQAQQDRR